MRKRGEPYLLLAQRSLGQLDEYVPESADAFFEHRRVQDAILLQILQIGENLSQLRTRFPEGFKSAPESWDQIIGLRNIIVHGYERVRISEIWEYVTEDLDELRESLLAAQSEGWFESPEGDDYPDDELNRSM